MVVTMLHHLLLPEAVKMMGHLSRSLFDEITKGAN